MNGEFLELNQVWFKSPGCEFVAFLEDYDTETETCTLSLKEQYLKDVPFRFIHALDGKVLPWE